MADITMSLDDTLELDTIIEESNEPLSSVTVTNGTDGTDFKSTGIKTGTYIFNPISSGTYNLNVNGRELSVEVTDPSNIPDSVVDNFEDGDISDYSGDTGVFSVVQDKTYNGNYALYSNVTNSSTISATESSGLPRTPSRGDTFRFSYYLSQKERDMFLFWGGGYSIRWYDSGRSGRTDEWILFDPDGNEIAQSGVRTPTNEWAVVEIDFSDPIVVDIYKASEYPDGNTVTTLSASDNSSDSGQIKIYANAGSSGEQWYDAFYVD